MTEAHTLTARIAYLRNMQTSIIDGDSKLAAFGITAQNSAVRESLTAIRFEATAIADRLDQLGHHDTADDARDGWALVAPHRLAGGLA